MIEMHEAAIVLRHATAHSLVLMDELGRGTSTFDGVAIAFGVARALAHDIKCRTLFTTHYHTLMPDFSADPAMALAHMGCLADAGGGSSGDKMQEDGEEGEMDITFLYRLTEGAVDKSYGMHVAKLAGLSMQVVQRAAEKSKELAEQQRRVFARNLLLRLAKMVQSVDGLGPGLDALLPALAAACQQVAAALPDEN